MGAGLPWAALACARSPRTSHLGGVFSQHFAFLPREGNRFGEARRVYLSSMAPSSGEPDSTEGEVSVGPETAAFPLGAEEPEGEASVGPETAAFPLGGGAPKPDNVYTIAPGTII